MWVRHEAFVELLQENPVIAAVKDATGLSRSMDSDCQIVFVLSGNLLGVKEVVSRVHEAGKLAMVHIDLIDGLAARDVAVDFIAESTRADGIISTRSNLVRRAKARGMLAVQRFFMLDSIALVNIEKHLSFEAADAVEILPGGEGAYLSFSCGEGVRRHDGAQRFQHDLPELFVFGAKEQDRARALHVEGGGGDGNGLLHQPGNPAVVDGGAAADPVAGAAGFQGG